MSTPLVTAGENLKRFSFKFTEQALGFENSVRKWFRSPRSQKWCEYGHPENPSSWEQISGENVGGFISDVAVSDTELTFLFNPMDTQVTDWEKRFELVPRAHFYMNGDKPVMFELFTFDIHHKVPHA